MHTIQYTIRNIPPKVDQVIRKRARQTGKSFNQTVVELLTLQTFGTIKPQPDENFDWLFGQLSLDEAFAEAIADQARIDEQMWQ